MTKSSSLLLLSLQQGAAGNVDLSRETARRALSAARSKTDRGSVLDLLASLETSPHVRYRHSSALVRLRPDSPNAWALHYHNAKECGYRAAAAAAKRRYAEVKKRWDEEKVPQFEAELERMKREDPASFDVILALRNARNQSVQS